MSPKTIATLLLLTASSLFAASAEPPPTLAPASAEAANTAIALAKEAYAAFDDIRAKLLANDIESLKSRILDNGEIPRPNARWDELAKDLARELPILNSDDFKKARPADLRADRRTIYQLDPAFEKVAASDVLIFTWSLPGTANLAKQHFPNGAGKSPTLAPDGTLIVYLKKIDNKWYWNPFGW